MLRRSHIAVRGALIALAALLPAIAAAQQPDGNWQQVTLDTVATLRIPADMQLRKDDKRYPDFLIYRVFAGQDQLLGIYLGNAPAFPNRRTASDAPVGPCTGLSTTTTDAAASSRDVLLHVASGNGFPTDLHFFYRVLQADAAQRADAVIASFAPTPTTRCETARR